MAENHQFNAFAKSLATFIPQARLMFDYPNRLAFASDASFYRLIPKLVVIIDNEAEMIRLLAAAGKFQVAVTFRAAGTSLSGQAVTDSVLVVVSQQWRNSRIKNNGESIWLQPSVIGAEANRRLSPWQKMIGPDPASIDSCKIGGIAANNASGMCCGVRHNSYHTLSAMKIIFADGSTLDTSNEKKRSEFIRRAPRLIEGLLAIREKIISDNHLFEKIRHKYRIKNTTGYGINAFVDFEDPIEILQHLMIGSEGTLGFIADIELKTIDVEANHLTGFYFFPDMETACQVVQALKALSPNAVELLDCRSLSSVSSVLINIEQVLSAHPHAAALLIEISEKNQQLVRQKQQQLETLLGQSGQLDNFSIALTDIAKQRAQLWKIRKGIFPSIGAARPPGTTVIIEDIAVDIAQLADCCLRLQALFVEHHYFDAVIFGHALDGNIHFVFAQDFSSATALENYRALMKAISQLISEEFNGSLKAEHGTGRNMAPFVEVEWGPTLYQIMQEIKHLFDPNNILNPGVIINDDAEIHLKHIKPMAITNSQLDPCIECGFCESVCPSQRLSWTPRQRIIVWREIKRLASLSNSKNQSGPLKELRKAFDLLGNKTCATTGMCELRCPVGINTGQFILEQRASQSDKRMIMPLAMKLYSKQIKRFNQLAHLLLEKKPVPSDLPVNNLAEIKNTDDSVRHRRGKVYYFASCGNQVFDQKWQGKTASDAIQSLVKKAGYQLAICPNLKNQCCGQSFLSNGESRIASNKNRQLANSIASISNDETVAVISDGSSCDNIIQSLAANGSNSSDKFFLLPEFLQRMVIPFVKINPLALTVALHLPCHIKKSAMTDSMIALTKICCKEVKILSSFECCGFAGSKGITLPELNQSSLEFVGQELSDCELGVTLSSSCQRGLTQYGELPFISLVQLLDFVTVASPVD